ncbi:hypothetical protein [Peribacillus sp. NPDC058075]|uniref:hypothetical protein n=1 Tax=unclassified Peribacillus TaxID=2675266 RepID=UPI0036DBB66C
MVKTIKLQKGESNIMKKLCAFSVSLIILFAFVAPSFASKEFITETSTEQEPKEYVYFLKV